MADTCDALLHAERRRAAAVVARDVDALAPLLHDGLVYVHATGVRHDKAGVLRFVASGPEFLEVAFDVHDREALAGAAVLIGALHLRLRRAGESTAVTAQSWASALWLHDASLGWRLRAFQSTGVAR